MNIYLATDHAGFELKEAIKKFLDQNSHNIIDLGALAFDPNDDYPDFIAKAAMAVSADPNSRAIIFGKTGQGEAMVANKIAGARAMVWYGGDFEFLRLSRAHNDANILSLAGGYVSAEIAKEATDIWLMTPFSGEERHIRRLQKIDSNYKPTF